MRLPRHLLATMSASPLWSADTRAPKQLTRVYNQIFGPGRRFGDGEIWNSG